MIVYLCVVIELFDGLSLSLFVALLKSPRWRCSDSSKMSSSGLDEQFPLLNQRRPVSEYGINVAPFV